MAFIVTLHGQGVAVQEDCPSRSEALRTLSRLWRELSSENTSVCGFISRENFDTIAILENGRYRNLESKVPIEAPMISQFREVA